MVDQYDDGRPVTPRGILSRLNIRKIPKKEGRRNRLGLARIRHDGPPRSRRPGGENLPRPFCNWLMSTALTSGEDGALAEMLAKMELDGPIPSDAFMAVAEILSYVIPGERRAESV